MSAQTDMAAKLAADVNELFDALVDIRSRLDQLIASQSKVAALVSNVTADIAPEQTKIGGKQ
ncbi:hypothetical protein SBF1_50009 [Candidatus Desulfosporosinus infrequens]|uniref:Uncharacterized protein n=1 Tax=Candidatus Desulfosporosinus infrequens TaxID=2043169 RepID=A0A2U3LGQ7_9FIRM|nr:hypothetical protein SBF1_50009 [Candidatus Desulfosporosinus infrequens]